MRIVYAENGDCRVIATQGYLEAFLEEQPDPALQGVQGVTFFLDSNLRPRGVRFRQRNHQRRNGVGLKRLLRLAQSFARENPATRTMPNPWSSSPPNDLPFEWGDHTLWDRLGERPEKAPPSVSAPATTSVSHTRLRAGVVKRRVAGGAPVSAPQQ